MDWKDQLEPDTQKKSKVRKAKRSKISDLSKLSKKSKDPEIIKLAKELQDENWEVRKKAVKALWGLKEKAIPILTIALEDEYMWVRVAADEAIRHILKEQETELCEEENETNRQKDGTIKNELMMSNKKEVVGTSLDVLVSRSIKELGEAYTKSENEKVIAKLSKLGIRVLNPLLRLLREESEKFIQLSNEIYKKHGNTERGDEIYSQLNSKSNNFVYNTTSILGNIVKKMDDSTSLTDQLFRLIEEERELSIIRERAVWVLGEIGSEKGIIALIDALNDEILEINKAAEEALKRIGKKAIIPLINAIQSKQDYYSTESENLRYSAKPHYSSDIEGLYENFSFFISRCFDVLSSYGDDSLTPILKLLIDRNVSLDISLVIRANAIDTLGKIGHTIAVEPLLEILEEEEDNKGDTANLKIRTIWALVKIGDQKAIEPLIKLLSHEEKEVRNTAVSALIKLGDEEATKPILKLMKNAPIIIKECFAWFFCGQMSDRLFSLITDRLQKNEITLTIISNMTNIIYETVKEGSKEFAEMFSGCVPLYHIEEVGEENNLDKEIVKEIIVSLLESGVIWEKEPMFYKTQYR